MSDSEFDKLCYGYQGCLRLPMSRLVFALALYKIKLPRDHSRSVENMQLFPSIVFLLANRVRQHLAAFKQDSWKDVPLLELFVDVQAIVFFVQQFCEDLAKLLRFAIPSNLSKEQNLSPKFGRLCSQLKTLLPPGDALRSYLEQHEGWLRQLKDLRDDLAHRTAFDRARSIQFPSFVDVVVAGGNKGSFLGAPDLTTFMSGFLREVLMLSITAEDFIFNNLAKSMASPPLQLPPAVYVEDGDVDGLPVGQMSTCLSKEQVELFVFYGIPVKRR